nr:hypothetical protein BgiMline_033324 [Biomphalaria glabrata]
MTAILKQKFNNKIAKDIVFVSALVSGKPWRPLARTSHTLFNFVAVIFLICCVGIAVTAHTMGNHDVRGAVRGFFALLVINVVNGGLILVTSHRAYIAYEHLLRKLLLKESELRIMGIPSTYVTIFSVTMATLIIRGIHRELFHKPKQQQH